MWSPNQISSSRTTTEVIKETDVEVIQPPRKFHYHRCGSFIHVEVAQPPLGDTRGVEVAQLPREHPGAVEVAQPPII